MTPAHYIDAARVPLSLAPQTFGLWQIQRRHAPDIVGFNRKAFIELCGSPYQTLLRRASLRTLHRQDDDQEIVMEDSTRELQRHLPIWLAAYGRVLVTGLGLGCVVRGLLANPNVQEIDVIESDPGIIDAIGPEFFRHRVVIHCEDALTCPLNNNSSWDFAWHDIWCDEHKLDLLHAKLLMRFDRFVNFQGAWQLPRSMKRLWPRPLIGGSRRRRLNVKSSFALLGRPPRSERPLSFGDQSCNG